MMNCAPDFAKSGPLLAVRPPDLNPLNFLTFRSQRFPFFRF